MQIRIQSLFKFAITSMVSLNLQKSKEETGTEADLSAEFQRMSRSFFA